MRRYWIDRSKIFSDKILIDGEEYHHICGVCRNEIGDRFEVISEGAIHLVEICAIKKGSAQAVILETHQLPELCRPFLKLALSLCRPQIFDNIVEKSVELGIHSIHPFISERSFSQDPSLVQKKSSRLLKIVRSATQQCGRGDLMRIDDVVPLSLLLANFNQQSECKGLFAYEGGGTSQLGAALAGIKKDSAREVWFFVGSEGGFSLGEVELFQKAGLAPLTLGSQVLRVETACVVLAGIIKYELGLLT